MRQGAVEKCSQLSPIDLSLAASYLPGIYALLKVLLVTLHLLDTLNVGKDQEVIVSVACLYVDKCFSIRYILDTGACAVCVLLSLCVNTSRINSWRRTWGYELDRLDCVGVCLDDNSV